MKRNCLFSLRLRLWPFQWFNWSSSSTAPTFYLQIIDVIRWKSLSYGYHQAQLHEHMQTTDTCTQAHFFSTSILLLCQTKIVIRLFFFLLSFLSFHSIYFSLEFSYRLILNSINLRKQSVFILVSAVFVSSLSVYVCICLRIVSFWPIIHSLVSFVYLHSKNWTLTRKK